MGVSRELGDYATYVEVDALHRRIPFTSTATPEHGVAEGAVALLHALELDLAHVHNTEARPGTRHGLRGNTVGIVGMGSSAIGSPNWSTAGSSARLSLPQLHPDVERRYDARRLDLAELFATADHVSLPLPNSAPIGLIGHAELAHANGCTLINTTSTSGLVDPAALRDALRDGRPRSVALEGRYSDPHHEHLRAWGANTVLMLPAYTSWDTEPSHHVGWRTVVETYLAVARGAAIPHRLA